MKLTLTRLDALRLLLKLDPAKPPRTLRLWFTAKRRKPA